MRAGIGVEGSQQPLKCLMTIQPGRDLRSQDTVLSVSVSSLWLL